MLKTIIVKVIFQVSKQIEIQETQEIQVQLQSQSKKQSNQLFAIHIVLVLLDLLCLLGFGLPFKESI
jgi:hypothetical protein